jgi:hypothetical protein
MAIIKLEGNTKIVGNIKFDIDFNVTKVPGLQLWLDSTTGLYDQTSGGSIVTGENSTVARWEDQSGNGRHCLQSAGSNQPILKTNVKNGKNALRFDGARWFDQSYFTSLLVDSHTVFVVAQTNTGGSDNVTEQGQAIYAGTGYHQGIMFLGNPSSNQVVSYLWNASITSASNTISYTQGNWIIASHTVSQAGSDFTSALNCNGTIQTTSLPGPLYTPYGGFVGAANPGGGTYKWLLNGFICEIIAFNNEVSSDNQTLIRTYLNDKWAVL